MMRVVVCVKEVLDASGPLTLTEEVPTLENAGLVPIANPADLAAVAMFRALLAAGSAEITAISVGPEPAERVLRSAIAAGADKAVRVWDNALANSSTEVTARVLAAAIGTMGFDLVVCGSRGVSGGSGYTGPALAELLGYALVCGVSGPELAGDAAEITVRRRLERGDRELVACRLPAVLTVDDGAAEVPYASLSAMLTAERTEVPVMDLASIGLKPMDVRPASADRLVGYVPPRPRTKKSAAPKNLTPQQQMQQAMMGGASKKGGSVIEGDPKTAAREIVRFLESNGLLSREEDAPAL